MKKCIAIDFGFGWTKVATKDGTFRFPSWIGMVDDKAGEIRDRVKYDGKEYAIGEDVKYLNKKININGMSDLIAYYPVFIKGILAKLGIEPKDAYIVTGIPPVYKEMKSQIEKIFDNMEIDGLVVSQTTGIFSDVMDDVKGDIILVLDPGYNTFDFLVVTREGGEWRKVRSGTLAGQGVNKAVELFKEKIGHSIIKTQPTNTLTKAFEEGKILIAGSFEDVTSEKESAIDDYIELIKGRLTNELGEDLIATIEEVVLGGGGANFIDPNALGFRNATKPNAPEFSQARGYLKMADCNG